MAERPYADYSAEYKAEVLALVDANHGNVQQTARDTGIPHQTIRFWLANSDKYSNVQTVKRLELSQKLKNIAHQCADQLPGMLVTASVKEVVGAMAQSIEKSQLLDGLPTSITEQVERTDVTIILQSALADAIDITPED